MTDFLPRQAFIRLPILNESLERITQVYDYTKGDDEVFIRFVNHEAPRFGINYNPKQRGHSDPPGIYAYNVKYQKDHRVKRSYAYEHALGYVFKYPYKELANQGKCIVIDDSRNDKGKYNPLVMKLFGYLRDSYPQVMTAVSNYLDKHKLGNYSSGLSIKDFFPEDGLEGVWDIGQELYPEMDLNQLQGTLDYNEVKRVQIIKLMKNSSGKRLLFDLYYDSLVRPDQWFNVLTNHLHLKQSQITRACLTLGIDSIYDTGLGIINRAEPCQLVCFTERYIQILDIKKNPIRPPHIGSDADALTYVSDLDPDTVQYKLTSINTATVKEIKQQITMAYRAALAGQAIAGASWLLDYLQGVNKPEDLKKILPPQILAGLTRLLKEKTLDKNNANNSNALQSICFDMLNRRHFKVEQLNNVSPGLGDIMKEAAVFGLTNVNNLAAYLFNEADKGETILADSVKKFVDRATDDKSVLLTLLGDLEEYVVNVTYGRKKDIQKCLAGYFNPHMIKKILKDHQYLFHLSKKIFVIIPDVLDDKTSRDLQELIEPDLTPDQASYILDMNGYDTTMFIKPIVDKAIQADLKYPEMWIATAKKLGHAIPKELENVGDKYIKLKTTELETHKTLAKELMGQKAAGDDEGYW